MRKKYNACATIVLRRLQQCAPCAFNTETKPGVFSLILTAIVDAEHYMKLALLILSFATCIVTAAPAFSAARPIDLYGDPAPIAAATRTIVITPDTKWVNVQGGEVIKFVVGDQSFAWNFFVGWLVSSFDLALVAPPGLLPHSVIAYVSPDPRFRRF
jgi:hypothetical protein